jgi:hypothetical protein
MKNKIKLRFNLGRGKNYRKWKIEYPNSKPIYLDPSEVKLVLEGCLLKNYKKTAQRIYDGSNKTVCSWVICDNITINEPTPHLGGKVISYNPKLKPYWVYEGNDADNFTFETIISDGRELFVI